MKQVNTVTLYKNFPVTGYDNQVYYKSKEYRKNAFLKYKYKTLEDISMVNLTTGTIRTKLNYYVGNMVNYALIETDDKDYYYFIDSVEWQSNGYCILHLSIDAWQTYVYDLTFHDSYIEREHVVDDTFGKHIVDEGLPAFGTKAITTYRETIGTSELKLCIAIADTSGMTDKDTGEQIPAYIYSSGTYSTAVIYVGMRQVGIFNGLIDYLVSDNKIDSIVGVYMCAIDEEDTDNWGVLSYHAPFGGDSIRYLKNYCWNHMTIKTINRASSIDGYKPVNNKCFCYPFNYLTISNSCGNSMNYQFELQSDPMFSARFKIYFPMQHGANILCEPLSMGDSVNRIFAGSSNLEVGWIANTYSAYYSANKNTLNAQSQTIEEDYLLNSINNGMNAISGVTQSVGSGNIGGMVSSLANYGISELSNEITKNQKFRNMNASLADVKSKGNTLKGQFTVNGVTQTESFGIIFYLMQVSAECAKMIDDYFSMYGYKVATIKKPQWTSRPYWNFIKTSGCNVTGDVPCDILRIIEQMFDNGTTIWHDVNYMYKYSTYKANNKPK